RKIDYYSILKKIKDLGPQIVILTDGDKGAWAMDEKRFYFAKPYPIQVLEKTGAGDSFGAGFLAGYLHFQQIEKSLILASLNAASVINKIGSTKGLLTLAQAQRLIKKNNNLVSIKNIN
ncbi:MAG: carbohydrate kinase family protein, partial [Minisyncoccia bacterium]